MKFKIKILDIFLYFTCLVFIMTFFVFKFFLFLDYQLQDKIFSKEDVSNNVIIIAIDEKSIQNYGQWPWDRSRHADLIEKLEKNNVKVIGYDFTFSERSSDDEYFLETIKKYDNLVFPFEGNLKLEKNQKAVFSDFLFPLKEIRENSLFGFTTLVPDFDAKVRRAPLFVYSENKEEKFYPFFLLVLERANYLKKEDLTNYNFKLDSKNLLLIKFFGPRETFKTFSYLDVMNESFDASIFNNKIVLVGATAKNLHDEYFTPTSKKSAISGVEIQANLIESFLQNNFLYRVENTYFYFLLFLFLLFLTRKIALKEKFIFSILNLFLLIFFYILFVIIVHVFGYLFSIFYPILFIIIVYFISYLKKYFQEKKEKQKIYSLFSQYVSKEVVEEMTKNDEKIKLGGVKKKITILFSDIRSFTTMSEKLKPEDLVSFLNTYLTDMTEIIFEKKGVVDKFIGDAIMAFWGAPLKNDNQENDAVSTALKMIEKLKKDKYEINIGIAINTGEVVVGNLGSEQRFDYTVIGDDVNLASRMEGLTKYYGAEILISSKTKEKLSDEFLLKYIDTVAVKGKKIGVKLYQVLGYKKDILDLDKYLEKYMQGIKYYLSQDWDLAEKIFLNLKKNNKEKQDKILDIYLERISVYKKNPPDDFDGIFRADFK